MTLRSAAVGGGRLPSFDAVVSRACFPAQEAEEKEEEERAVARVWLCAPNANMAATTAELTVRLNRGSGELEEEVLCEGDLVRCFWCNVGGRNVFGQVEIRALKSAMFKRIASPAPNKLAEKAGYHPRQMQDLSRVAHLGHKRTATKRERPVFVDLCGIVVKADAHSILLCMCFQYPRTTSRRLHADAAAGVARARGVFGETGRSGGPAQPLRLRPERRWREVRLHRPHPPQAQSTRPALTSVLFCLKRSRRGKSRGDFEFLESWAKTAAAVTSIVLRHLEQAEAVRQANEVVSLRQANDVVRAVCDSSTICGQLRAHGAWIESA